VSEPHRHHLHPKARREAEAAVRWYRQHGGSVIALAFAQAVDDAITAIIRAPDRWTLKGKWRRFVLSRFPYVIAYQERGDEILIGAVAHTSRDPETWEER
jgi:plasmid stabilization system protein ParE